MNRTKINADELIGLLDIYKHKDSSITLHMVYKLLYHLEHKVIGEINGDSS